MAERLSAAELAELQARHAACLPGPWFWNSYSNIETQVPKGHPWDLLEPDEWNINGLGVAHIAYVAQAPEHWGHGDELHSAQARAHAAFLEHAWQDVRDLLAAYEALAAEVGMPTGALERDKLGDGRRNRRVAMHQPESPDELRAQLQALRAAVQALPEPVGNDSPYCAYCVADRRGWRGPIEEHSAYCPYGALRALLPPDTAP